MNIKKGDKGQAVRDMQVALNRMGYGLSTDGIFGAKSEAALMSYQKSKGLVSTGELDSITAQSLGVSLQLQQDEELLPGAIKAFLPDGEYVAGDFKKTGVTLHHSASSGDPYAMPRVWAKDSRGRVCTHYGIGGWGEHDGKVLQYIPLSGHGYHIGLSRMGFDASQNVRLNQRYIGIEICNWGYLELKGGKFYNYTGQVVPDEQVVKLAKPWRTFQYWHAYTPKQVQAVRWLLAQLSKRFGFRYENRQANADWLELSWDAMRGDRVLTTHSNFEYGKFDCSPQPLFFDMVADAHLLGSSLYEING